MIFRLLVISILFGLHDGSFTCINGYLLRNYYIGTLVILAVNIVQSFATMVLSMQGSIRDSKPRRHISALLYLRFAMFVPEGIWVIVATYWTFGHSFTCDWSVYWAARGAVICAWIVGFWMFIGLLLVFDPLGSAEHRVNLGDSISKSGKDYLIGSSKSKHSKVWETR
jgi:sn1-specific diacylglycerol lipase